MCVCVCACLSVCLSVCLCVCLSLCVLDKCDPARGMCVQRDSYGRTRHGRAVALLAPRTQATTTLLPPTDCKNGVGGRRMGDLKQEHFRAGGEEEILLTSNA